MSTIPFYAPVYYSKLKTSHTVKIWKPATLGKIFNSVCFVLFIIIIFWSHSVLANKIQSGSHSVVSDSL